MIYSSKNSIHPHKPGSTIQWHPLCKHDSHPMAMVENLLRTCLIVKDTITINSVKLLMHLHILTQQRKHHVIQKDMTSRWGEKVSVSRKSSIKSLDMTSG